MHKTDFFVKITKPYLYRDFKLARGVSIASSAECVFDPIPVTESKACSFISFIYWPFFAVLSIDFGVLCMK